MARLRLLKLARVCAAGMLLALTLLAIAHLPPVRARVAAFGVRLLHDRYGIDARIERLDYNLFALRGSV